MTGSAHARSLRCAWISVDDLEASERRWTSVATPKRRSTFPHMHTRYETREMYGQPAERGRRGASAWEAILSVLQGGPPDLAGPGRQSV